MLPPNAEKIFVGSYDFHMYALSSKDGSILWKYKTNEIIKCTPCVTTNFLIFGKLTVNILNNRPMVITPRKNMEQIYNKNLVKF